MPSAALPRQAVTGWPSLVSVAPITLEASATAPPQTALWGLQLLPAAGAVKVWMPAVPAANSRSVPSGIVSRARPPLPFQPVATVDVPDGLPAAENRVSRIDVDVAPRFQITCRTPSPVRARPSCAPGAVGPLTRVQPPEGAAPAEATQATAPSARTRSADANLGDGRYM